MIGNEKPGDPWVVILSNGGGHIAALLSLSRAFFDKSVSTVNALKLCERETCTSLVEGVQWLAPAGAGGFGGALYCSFSRNEELQFVAQTSAGEFSSEPFSLDVLRGRIDAAMAGMHVTSDGLEQEDVVALLDGFGRADLARQIECPVVALPRQRQANERG